MQMKEIGPVYQKNLLKALIDEFKLPLPFKNEIEIEKIVYKKNKWLEIIDSQVKTHPNLNQFNSYLRIRRPSFSQVILFNNKNDFLVQLRHRIGCNDFVIEFPGGAIEKNETPKDAAKRELKEELNLDNVKLSLLGECYMDPMRSNFKGYFFKGSPKKEIKPFTSFIKGEIEESLFIWMSRLQIKTYYSLLPSSSITALSYL